MQFNLAPHPATPPSTPGFDVWVDVQYAYMLSQTASLHLWFCVGAPLQRFVVPEPAESHRKDRLWETTCFEAFLQTDGDRSYREWNFAPSGDWAAHDFADYRKNAQEPEIDSPHVDRQDNLTWWEIGVALSLESRTDWKVGLSAVLEEKDGTKSYWALAHPNADKPDFHNADCFVAKLA